MNWKLNAKSILEQSNINIKNYKCHSAREIYKRIPTNIIDFEIRLICRRTCSWWIFTLESMQCDLWTRSTDSHQAVFRSFTLWDAQPRISLLYPISVSHNKIKSFLYFYCCNKYSLCRNYRILRSYNALLVLNIIQMSGPLMVGTFSWRCTDQVALVAKGLLFFFKT